MTSALQRRLEERTRVKNALSILAFLRDALRSGQRAALVTVTDVDGSSARAPGTHMAVCEDGRSAGSFSGGCVEAAVVGEALSVLRAAGPRQVRFGAGSPYMDIRLPCGGGMDLLFTPDPPLIAIEAAVARLETRRGASLELGIDGTLAVDAPGETGWRGDVFRVTHELDLQLIVFGHGAETLSLARLASAFTPAVRVVTPDRDILADAVSLGVEAAHLLSPDARLELHVDADTAVVLLFHDHDWENDILRWALGTTAFYIGAMGSRATHAARCAELLGMGCVPSAVERVVGPAGLIPASRDPDTLAVSILSQIVLEHGRAIAGRAAPSRHRVGERFVASSAMADVRPMPLRHAL